MELMVLPWHFRPINYISLFSLFDKKGTNINVSETLKCLLKPILLYFLCFSHILFSGLTNSSRLEYFDKILSSLTLFSISSYFFLLKINKDDEIEAIHNFIYTYFKN